MAQPVSVSRRDGIAIITIDNPPVNATSHTVRVMLLAACRSLATDSSVKAAVINAAGRTFVAGSDIREFDAPIAEPIMPDINSFIESLAVPVVAAIHGTALGGGFELAMGCHYRIAANTTKVGLPEIYLGMIPGAGGTQRLPRLIGVGKALDWILSGRHVSADEAKEAGAIDEIAQGDLLDCAVRAAQRLAMAKTIRRTGEQAIPGSLPGDFFADQRKAVAKRSRGFEAPHAAIDAVEAAAKPFAEGLAAETAISLRVKPSAQARAQRHLFFGEREVARIPDIPKDTPLRPIHTVGVIGAGTMGRGIVTACLSAGYSVRWVDQTQDALGRGVGVVTQIHKRDVEKKRLVEQAMTERLARLRTAVQIESLADADLIIEAAFEDMNVKQELFRQLDSICKPGAVLASNTSTLDVNQIAAATRRPQDVIGLHFFSPAHLMRLLEVVRGAKSSKDVVATAMAFGKQIGKVAVLSGVCFGFIGNRMFEGYIRESQMLLLEGATPSQVDRALTDFGMAMGPCAVIDLAGVDISFLTREGNRVNMPNDPRYCAIGDKLHHLGRHGQKTNKGFYRYVEGKALDDPEVEALIRDEAKRLHVKPRALSSEEIVARCIYPLIDEAARILTDGIALRPVDIDVVWVSGYGFPRYRGGPLFHADLLGLRTIFDGMHRFARELGNEFGYWTPAPLLQQLAASGKSFKDRSAS